MNELAIWIALASAGLSCYFSACTIALRTMSRVRLGELLEERQQSQRLEPFLRRSPKLGLMLACFRTVLNLIVLLAMLYVVEKHAAPSLPDQDFAVDLIALAAAGLLISIFGVAIPTSWARYAAEPLLARSMVLLTTLLKIFGPVASLLHMFDPIIKRISGSDRSTQENPLADEILSVVEEHEDSTGVDADQKDMLEAVIDLPHITAGQIMTPRTEMTGLDIATPLEQVKQVILKEGHSRIPVYEDTVDNILGILYAKDLIQFLGDGATFELRQVLREVVLVPETKSVRELLSEFKARKVHMAIVLDEYGGTAGLVTIEDVLEEIVGEIEDEYEPADDERPTITRVDDHCVEVDARVYVDDLNDELDLELPEDEDYDTVGGFVFSTLGHIPEAGEAFEFEEVKFTVLEAERNRVKRVRLEKQNVGATEQPPEAQAGAA